ncbi:hypothetical protein F3Y22_tig00110890pilonHSYRG01555 [Hibiscus syriacus]|uniref:Uncharacterized protein n=1 Tax=Hibiscus syriacus TaxID=106335 RepID=A0A6A2ZIT4_HIBSY|nr:hypothetical protein F3Y22_tig00110890pilonHSYRG01555 [Hibiscus syriacus]
MEGLCPRNRHSSLRTMNVPTLIPLIGHLESKVLRSPKDHLKPSVPNCSPHNNKRDIGNLLVPQLMVKPSCRWRECSTRGWDLQ